VIEAIGPDATLFVDANGAYGRKQALRFGRQLEDLGVTWFEEPVSSDDVEGLAMLSGRLDLDVTAGEYGTDLDTFRRLAGAVDCLQVDVTRCGGITNWIRIAATAEAHHVDVSGHCAPLQHLSVAAATANLRHLEYFHDHVRVESRLFEDIPVVVDGALTPSGEPGTGSGSIALGWSRIACFEFVNPHVGGVGVYVGAGPAGVAPLRCPGAGGGTAWRWIAGSVVGRWHR